MDEVLLDLELRSDPNLQKWMRHSSPSMCTSGAWRKMPCAAGNRRRERLCSCPCARGRKKENPTGGSRLSVSQPQPTGAQPLVYFLVSKVYFLAAVLVIALSLLESVKSLKRFLLF
ncbi:hypothetical protein D1007_40426 [Hordeum vulgare]|nr:hypothetical protein D1007_40426 [Hordeum vulgare]